MFHKNRVSRNLSTYPNCLYYDNKPALFCHNIMQSCQVVLSPVITSGLHDFSRTRRDLNNLEKERVRSSTERINLGLQTNLVKNKMVLREAFKKKKKV